jgi:hypothetical protein
MKYLNTFVIDTDQLLRTLEGYSYFNPGRAGELHRLSAVWLAYQIS